jgi:hypothetical protein
MPLVERIKTFPWTQVILLLLLITSILNLRETRRLQGAILDNGTVTPQIGVIEDRLNTANDHLNTMEESLNNIEACHRLLHPVWCR